MSAAFRRLALPLFPLFFIFVVAYGQDSIQLKVTPVQCYGLRNGSIEVVEVFWGTAPFYYSLDGQSYSTRPVFDLLRAGEYQMYVRDSTGYEEIYPILVDEPDELRVKLIVADSSVVSGEWVQIKATVYPVNSILEAIEWRPPNLFAEPNQLTQTVQIVDSTDIAIEIRNTGGCVATDQVFVPVRKTNLYFPNAFDPNSNQDNYFTLFAGEGVERIVSLQIFGRGGQLMYERKDFPPNDPLTGWNGKWRGRQAPSGVYPWVARIRFLDGSVQHFSGNVTLVN